ncbi:DUF2141 domain-containing protein [Phenylobacterium sp. LjRoot219]|uniref:DUF2141 domain-containing protein n=1 Tax=Phenylobacterium sp. LjRoot219 TaxID=3342283 RepID=UPI003ECE1AD4
MKARIRLWLAAAVAATLAGGAAHAAEACHGHPGGDAVKLTVEATNVRAAKGEVAITVYPDDVRRFLARGGKLGRVRTPAALPVTRACFWLPPGHYAVAVYHDQDGDRDFDRDGLGRPTEGFGFSNDAPARMGLPAFADVRFRLPAGGKTISLRMRYR